MVDGPDDFDPFRILVQLLLTEAVEAGNDQILMIARPQTATIYFLTRGHILRTVPVEYEHARGLFGCVHDGTRMKAADGRVKYSVRCRVDNEEHGECLSLLFQESPADDNHPPGLTVN